LCILTKFHSARVLLYVLVLLCNTTASDSTNNDDKLKNHLLTYLLTYIYQCQLLLWLHRTLHLCSSVSLFDSVFIAVELKKY